MQELRPNTPLSQPSSDQALSARVANMISTLRQSSVVYQNIYIIREGDASEVQFQNLLLEDRSVSAMSMLELQNLIQKRGY
mmetsp:Transcript_26670/g.37934  ORF Transcript_26670/g.37934 Transcript_26670/m.37934 type:complete len:81 (+) Transcript_26670:1-243(+)